VEREPLAAQAARLAAFRDLTLTSLDVSD